MSRGVGRVFKRKMQIANGQTVEDPIWWIGYYHRGKEYRESSGFTSEEKARKKLKKRLQDIGNRRFVPNEDRLTFDDMVVDLENEYRVNDRRTLSTTQNHIRHLRETFGMDRAVDIGPDRVMDYQVRRELPEPPSTGSLLPLEGCCPWLLNSRSYHSSQSSRCWMVRR